MEKNDIDSNTPFIQAFNQKTLTEVVIPYYIKNGVNLKNTKTDFSYITYKDEHKDEFTKHRKKGVFEIKNILPLESISSTLR